MSTRSSNHWRDTSRKTGLIGDAGDETDTDTGDTGDTGQVEIVMGCLRKDGDCCDLETVGTRGLPGLAGLSGLSGLISQLGLSL